jgi:hypothetical protein
LNAEVVMDLTRQAAENAGPAQRSPAPTAERAHERRRVSQSIKRFVEHPLTKLGIGLILITSGVVETYDTIAEDIQTGRLRLGHGVILLGFVNALAALPELIEGIERWLRYLESRESPARIDEKGDGRRE